jgi:hypothetical protein
MRKLILLAALALAACETTPTIRSDFDPSVNFAKYRTYSWIYQAPPHGMNPLIYERIRASIDRALMARGYTQANPGDFAVAFTVGRRDRVEVRDYGPYSGFYPGWGYGYRWGWAPLYRQVDIRNVTDGSLAIDFYDAATKRPIWHGTATKEIRPGRPVPQAEIDQAVSAVITRFPPRPGLR